MRSTQAALLASFAVLASTAGLAPAWAQVATGLEVSVNPVAGAGQTLLYPGGQYARVVNPLRQPGQKASDSGVIALHMPSRNPRPIGTTPAAPDRVAIAAPRPAPAPAPVRPAAPAPRFGNTGAAGAVGILGSLPTAPAQQLAKANPVLAAPSAGSAVDPNAAGTTKRSVILFAAGAADPAQSALDAIKLLAGDLNASMTNAGSRVQLIAYGGDKGDKGSDARRLSLKRALAIRQVLIDDGVASERIDVRAMGGSDDGGPLDRVDVYVKV
jgi:outer membrane protein OmpA-like peptidoglycan-associated protein